MMPSDNLISILKERIETGKDDDFGTALLTENRFDKLLDHGNHSALKQVSVLVKDKILNFQTGESPSSIKQLQLACSKISKQNHSPEQNKNLSKNASLNPIKVRKRLGKIDRKKKGRKMKNRQLDDWCRSNNRAGADTGCDKIFETPENDSKNDTCLPTPEIDLKLSKDIQDTNSNSDKNAPSCVSDDNYYISKLSLRDIENKLAYISFKIGKESDPTVFKESLVDGGSSHLFLPLDYFRTLPNFEECVIETRPIAINTVKGKIHSQKAIIASIPVSFSDINGIVRQSCDKVTDQNDRIFPQILDYEPRTER